MIFSPFPTRALAISAGKKPENHGALLPPPPFFPPPGVGFPLSTSGVGGLVLPAAAMGSFLPLTRK